MLLLDRLEKNRVSLSKQWGGNGMSVIQEFRYIVSMYETQAFVYCSVLFSGKHAWRMHVRSK